MKPSRVAALLLLALLIGSAHPAGDQKSSDPPKNQKVDAVGDPLPTGVLMRMGTLRFRHGSQIQFMQYSGDGKVLASHGVDQTIRLWDTNSGKELQALHVPEATNAPFSLSTDGKHLATTNTSRIRIWDTKTGKVVHAIDDPNGNVTAVVFSPDGKTVAATSGTDDIKFIEVESGKETRRIKGPQNQGNQGFFHQQLSFSSDGKSIAMSGYNANDNINVIQFLPLEEGKGGHTLKLDPNQNTQFQLIAPDHKTIAQWGNDQQIHIRDASDAEGKELQKIATQQGMFSFAYSADGKHLAVAGGDSQVAIYDVKTGNQVKTDAPITTPVTVMAFAPDGKSIALCGGASSIIRIVDTKKGKDVHEAVGHVGAICQVVVAPDGKTLATVGEDRVVCFWDMANGKEMHRIEVKGVEQPGVPGVVAGGAGAIAFSTDSKHLALAWGGQSLTLYDAKTGKEERTFGDQNTPIAATDIAFTPDGKSIAGVCTDGAVRLWDLRTGKETRRFPEGPSADPQPDPAKGEIIPVPTAGGISMVAISPNGKVMVTLGADTADGTGVYTCLRVWELATGKERKSIRFKDSGGPYPSFDYRQILVPRGGISDELVYPGGTGSNGMVVSPNGRYVALTSGATVHLVDLVKGKAVRQFGAQGEGLCGAEFSPDGKLLAAGASDGTLHFWDVATGTALGEFSGHRGAITTLTYASNGKSLVTGGVDTTALSWDVPSLTESFQETVKPLTQAQAEQLANDLADKDEKKAGEAIAGLAQSPKEAVAVLKERLKPVDPVEQQKLAQLIKDLSDNDFDAREKASAGLEKLGALAEPALRKRLDEGPDLEAKTRIEQLLQKLDKPVQSMELLSAIRAIEVLECIGTPEARKILEDLSKGADGAVITDHAKRALAGLPKN